MLVARPHHGPLARFCCQNPDCTDHGRRGGGNLTVCARYGKHKQIASSTAAPARPGSPNARARPCSARICPRRRPSRSSSTWPRAAASARPPDSSASTATPWSATAAWPATTPSRLHDELVAFSPRTREVQFDEKWSFVFKKQEHCDPTDPADANRGDCWDHVAFDPEHRLVVSVVPGARDDRGAPRRWSPTSSAGPGGG